MKNQRDAVENAKGKLKETTARKNQKESEVKELKQKERTCQEVLKQKENEQKKIRKRN